MKLINVIKSQPLNACHVNILHDKMGSRHTMVADLIETESKVVVARGSGKGRG